MNPHPIFWDSIKAGVRTHDIKVRCCTWNRNSIKKKTKTKKKPQTSSLREDSASDLLLLLFFASRQRKSFTLIQTGEIWKDGVSFTATASGSRSPLYCCDMIAFWFQGLARASLLTERPKRPDGDCFCHAVPLTLLFKWRLLVTHGWSLFFSFLRVSWLGPERER